MNFGQLKARLITFCKLEGWSETSPPPDWSALINQAVYEFSWRSEYNLTTATLTTVAGQAEYQLPNEPWKRISLALIGSSPLRITDENTLSRERPTWLVDPNGTPDRIWNTDPQTVRLYPTPSSNGLTITVRGVQAAPKLVAETDSPLCPEHYHEGIALFAAYQHGKSFAREDAAAAVTNYLNQAKSYIDDLRGYLSEETAAVFQRRVRRDVTQRLPLGWLVRNP